MLFRSLAVKGTVTAENIAGGICVDNYGTIYGCSFEGTVTAYRYAGGICGTNDANGTISSCYAIATITSTSNGITGGIAGRSGYEYKNIKETDTSNTSIQCCYFAGTVTSDNKGEVVGPIIGKSGGGGANSCLYNSDLYTKEASKGQGVTTENLCKQAPSNAFEKGTYSKPTADPDNGRMRTVEYSYPRLKEG